MFKNLFIFSLLLVLTINISYFSLLIGVTYIGWLENTMYLIALPILISLTYFKGNNFERLYIWVMILGMFFHFLLFSSEDFIFKDSTQWIFLVVILIASRMHKVSKFIFYTLLVFFISNCVLAIIEYRLQTNLFDYYFVERYSNFKDITQFRAFGLMKHPLYSANIMIIIMSFIMISKDINSKLKIGLLTLGSLALIAFNSRGALIIWICLFVYYYLFYNIKSIYSIISIVTVYLLFFNDFVYLVQQNSQLFGRLSEQDNLVDKSVLSRLASYPVFWYSEWNFEQIVLGGRIIYLPGSKYSLENGLLLTISWWGWIVGILKSMLELVISYIYLKNYDVKDRWIVMLASWGTAYLNNNTVNTFVFAFFIFTFVSIRSLENRQKLSNVFNKRKLKNIKLNH